MIYFNYFLRVIRHKYNVAKNMYKMSGLKYWWQMIVHDIDKFWPTSFIAHANVLEKEHLSRSSLIFNKEFSEMSDSHKRLAIERLKHCHRSKHHIQYWMLYISTTDKLFKYDIPEKYKIEMLCDK